MGLQKRRAATAQPKQKPMEAPSLLPVTLTDECIHIRGSTVLGNLSAQAWVSHADNDMLVLGMKSADGATSMADFALGTLHCRRWLCCARNKLWWMTPEWGTTANELPPETQVSGWEGAWIANSAVMPWLGQGGSFWWSEAVPVGVFMHAVFAHGA